MNRDLLYSLGLALAAWPPLIGGPPKLVPDEPPPITASVREQEAEAACLVSQLLPASTRPTEKPAKARR